MSAAREGWRGEQGRRKKEIIGEKQTKSVIENREGGEEGMEGEGEGYLFLEDSGTSSKEEYHLVSLSITRHVASPGEYL